MTEREKLIELMTEYYGVDPMYYGEDALALADYLISKGVVIPVRCGSCKRWKINPNNMYGGYCRYAEGATVDHFCSYGERK